MWQLELLVWADVRYVIRIHLAWAQEYGRAGRDGNQSYAYILYSDNDIHHVGFWARGMAKQHRPNDIDDVAQQFSDAVPFCYAHLAGNAGAESCFSRLMKMLFICDAQKIVLMFVSKHLAH